MSERTPIQVIGSARVKIAELDGLLLELKDAILADDTSESVRLAKIKEHLDAIQLLMGASSESIEVEGAIKAAEKFVGRR